MSSSGACVGTVPIPRALRRQMWQLLAPWVSANSKSAHASIVSKLARVSESTFGDSPLPVGRCNVPCIFASLPSQLACGTDSSTFLSDRPPRTCGAHAFQAGHPLGQSVPVVTTEGGRRKAFKLVELHGTCCPRQPFSLKLHPKRSCSCSLMLADSCKEPAHDHQCSSRRPASTSGVAAKA